MLGDILHIKDHMYGTVVQVWNALKSIENTQLHLRCFKQQQPGIQFPSRFGGIKVDLFSRFQWTWI